MKKNSLKKKTAAWLAALAVFLTSAELPLTQQPVYAETAETNTTFAAARNLEFGSSMAGTLSTSDNIRYYKFSLKEANQLQLGVERNQGGWGAVYIKFYDASQTEIYSERTYNGSFSLGPLYFTGGDYYMTLALDSSYDETFSFRANVDTLGENFVETQDANNDRRENASVIGLKKTYKGVLAINDDIDYYRFQVPAAGQIRFNLTNAAGDSIRYTFYDQSLNQAYTDTVIRRSKTSPSVSVKKGIYYLAIEKANVNGSVGSYTFSIDHMPQGGTSGSNTGKVTVKQVKIKSVQNSARKKMTVKWNKVSKVSGYELWHSTNSNFKKGVVKKKLSSSVTKKTYSGLKKKKTYYVKIRAYKNVNDGKKYGKWSSKKSVVIRK